MGITYKDSGVDVDAGNNFVKKIGPIVKSTFTENVISDIGGFGALFSGSFPGYDEPILVSGTDGVGTKVEIVKQLKIYDTIGIDAVAMCVNDIIVSGAKPLFFLDYISCGKLNEDIMVDIVKGIADGCKDSGCSLIGGETAEHPKVMDENDFDIAGFSVGVVDKKNIINGKKIKNGDIVIGLPSSGVHSNGFSLVRKLLFDIKGYKVDQKFDTLSKSLGETLLTPTTLYVKNILSCLDSGIDIKGIVHITGGGFYENIPRILPENVSVKIEKSSFKKLPIFELIQKEGDISDREMYTTFNMGVGMMIFVDKSEAENTIEVLKKSGSEAKIIGEVVEGADERVTIY